MTSFRQLHTSIWKDSWFLELEPDEKFLFIYLFGNESTSLSGIYKLPHKVIAFETGLDRQRIDEILDKFARDGKVFCEDDIIWIVNMRKFHETKSNTVQTRINRDVQDIPDCELKRKYIAYHAQNIPYRYPIDTSQQLNKIRRDKSREDEISDYSSPPDDEVSEEDSSTSPPDELNLPEDTLEKLKHGGVSITVRDASNIFSMVTGMVHVPGNDMSYVEKIRALADEHKEETVDYLRQFWERWTTSKTKDGRPYSKTNLGWIDWALANELPEARNGNKIHIEPGQERQPYGRA